METTDLAVEIKRLLAAQASVWSIHDLQDDLPIGRDGLGLDSISIAEVLVTIDERFGVPFSTILFESGPLTVGKLVRFVQDGQSNQNSSFRRAA